MRCAFHLAVVLLVVFVSPISRAATWVISTPLPDAPWAIRSLAFSPDGKILAVGSGKTPASSIPFGKGKVEFRDASTLKLVCIAADGESAFDIRFIDNDIAAVGSLRLETWNVHTGKRVTMLTDVGFGRKSTYRYDTITMTDDRRLIAGDGHVWDLSSGKMLPDSFDAELQLYSSRGGDAFVMSPDGAPIATANHEKDEGNQIRVWDRQTGTKLASIEGPGKLWKSPVLSFSPDGKSLLCGDGIHDAKTLAKKRQIYLENNVLLAGYNPDGSRVFRVLDNDTEVSFFDAATAEKLDSVTLPDRHLITSIAFTADGKTIAVGWDNQIGRCGVDFFTQKN